MSCIYLGGCGKLGLAVAMSVQTLPLCAPCVASSGAALTMLALCLGGRKAVELLDSKAYVSLLKGFGSSKERKALARSWLARLGIPLDAGIVDLEKLGCAPCGFVLYCAERQTPMLFNGLSETDDLALTDLVAALCSLMPVRTSAFSLLDAEHILPFECLASAVSPPPLFVVGPTEPSLRGHRGMEFSALLMSLNDRMLALNSCRLPMFRVRVPHFLETLVSETGDFSLTSSSEAGAALLCFVMACVLETLKARPAPSAQRTRREHFPRVPEDSWGGSLRFPSRWSPLPSPS
jgi:hypothetical protein